MAEENDYSDDQASADYLWLTNQAGGQLQELAGGTTQAPVFSRSSVEHLQQISDVAARLADYYSDAGEVEDPSLTPFDELPEDAQKAVREQEENRDDDSEPVKTQEQRIAEGQSQVESNPHPLEDASGFRPGQSASQTESQKKANKAAATVKTPQQDGDK